ncbi:toxin [Mycobacterium lacus]|uniref:Toxin n=1 Tax=Mycobacterium lacus TaxID=169765 RepID=A0A1X1XNR5_9MYCO|nr:toxin [Mycobacterium lacus]MCV7123427.1 toxin [Mycobacterium lacus]ORW00497.1 toxin [Mycobacterium lacus]BBX99080.1 toxin [Mycobacterium lacus]
MIAPGAIAPRRDTDGQLYVAVLSNAIHLAADTGRLITCPFVPGQIPDEVMAMVVTVDQPPGALLPELVQWLPRSALDEPIGTIGETALRETASIVTALIT